MPDEPNDPWCNLINDARMYADEQTTYMIMQTINMAKSKGLAPSDCHPLTDLMYEIIVISKKRRAKNISATAHGLIIGAERKSACRCELCGQLLNRK